MGDQPLSLHRNRIVSIVPYLAVFLEHAVRAPRNKMELIGIRIEIEKEVVAVA